MFVQTSGVLKRVAVRLSKICNDLRLLLSGPAARFGKLLLPAVQAGSSILPGKVNPVIRELVNQVAFEVISFNITVTFAAEAGQLQLGAFEPIICYSLVRAFSHLRSCRRSRIAMRRRDYGQRRNARKPGAPVTRRCKGIDSRPRVRRLHGDRCGGVDSSCAS